MKVTPNSALLSGTLINHGDAVTYFFQYGTTTSYGATSSSHSTARSGEVHVAVTGLRTSTTYHYRIVARFAGGVVYGSDRYFTTHMATSKQHRPASRAKPNRTGSQHSSHNHRKPNHHGSRKRRSHH